MNTLFEKSIRTLELPVVLEMLASLAVSEAAKEKCRQLLPVCDLEEAARLQEETQSARERLGLYGSPSFSGVKDVSRALNRADHGGVPDIRVRSGCGNASQNWSCARRLTVQRHRHG